VKSPYTIFKKWLGDRISNIRRLETREGWPKKNQIIERREYELEILPWI